MFVLGFFGKGEIVDDSIESEEGKVDAVGLISLGLIEFEGENLAATEINNIELPILQFYGEDNMWPWRLAVDIGVAKYFIRMCSLKQSIDIFFVIDLEDLESL